MNPYTIKICSSIIRVNTLFVSNNSQYVSLVFISIAWKIKRQNGIQNYNGRNVTTRLRKLIK